MLIKDKCMVNFQTKNNIRLADHLYHPSPITASTGRVFENSRLNRCQYCGKIHTKKKALVTVEGKDI